MHEENVKVLEDWKKEHPGEEIPEYFVTAMTISPDEHVKIQACIQRYVDSAISKTCNLPSNATVEDVSHIYMLMWLLDCKGGTVYRDGSRTEQILHNKQECPECHEIAVISENGCDTCHSCGWSKCNL